MPLPPPVLLACRAAAVRVATGAAGHWSTAGTGGGGLARCGWLFRARAGQHPPWWKEGSAPQYLHPAKGSVSVALAVPHTVHMHTREPDERIRGCDPAAAAGTTAAGAAGRWTLSVQPRLALPPPELLAGRSGQHLPWWKEGLAPQNQHFAKGSASVALAWPHTLHTHTSGGTDDGFVCGGPVAAPDTNSQESALDNELVRGDPGAATDTHTQASMTDRDTGHRTGAAKCRL